MDVVEDMEIGKINESLSKLFDIRNINYCDHK
jgi:hypothetical protein